MTKLVTESGALTALLTAMDARDRARAVEALDQLRALLLGEAAAGGTRYERIVKDD